MANKTAREMIVGLDIGTSKVIAMVGDVGADGQLHVIGLGSHPSKGLQRGVVVNIEETMKSIRRAVEEAELMAGCRIQSVFVGISGAHIKSQDSHGIVATRNKIVAANDIERVIEAARAIPIGTDRKVLHVMPQEFRVDDQDGITEPVGMTGVRLEARVHMITAADSAAQNIRRCVEGCGLRLDKLILEQVASSHAVLQADERDLGICLVDIGAGTSDIAIYKGGSIRHTAVVPIAGSQVTNDVAVVFRSPPQSAEEIKLKHGCALPQLVAPDELIDVPSVGGQAPRKLKRQELAQVIRARYEELFRLIRKELHRTEFYDVVAGGVVLTGGSSKMPGVIELAEEVFEMPVRLGVPQSVVGLTEVSRNPVFATAVGLLLYGKQHHSHPADSAGSGLFGPWLERLNQWFKGQF